MPSQPDDVHRTDDVAELQRHVQERLGGQLQEFRLVVEAGGLILHGRVATYYAKQLAQHAVMQAARAPIMANCIEVS